ncbi:MAG: hypothetical protein ABIE70_01830 [bacterium]
MSYCRIHIFGASGSGTTTLATAIAGHLGWAHFDTDDYFWLQTDPPFSDIRSVEERLAMLRQDLAQKKSWLLSGALDGWGDPLIPLFDLVVFLYVPWPVRLRRLHDREIERFGRAGIAPGGRTHGSFLKLIEWASKYDTAGTEMRSLVRHQRWIESLTCAKLTIEGTPTLNESVAQVMKILKSDGSPGGSGTK